MTYQTWDPGNPQVIPAWTWEGFFFSFFFLRPVNLIGPTGTAEAIVMPAVRVSEEDHSLEPRGLLWEKAVVLRLTTHLASALASASPEFPV